MSLESRSPGKKKGVKYGSASLYLAVPTLLAASILIGFFLGRWADEYFGTEPYLVLIGLALGMATAGRELYRLVKKVQAMDEAERKDSE